MIIEPIPHPRDVIFFELERRKKQFFAEGNSIQKIPIGLSGAVAGYNPTNQQRVLQLSRAKYAPALREQANSGKTLQTAARALSLSVKRAQLIAQENDIFFHSK